ncbi:carbohydrate porin [Vibrio sp. TH_r3]|uniref:carbohydrate porin n=1 Tax=Vibrio sp. TH_r3 TaxID=3082084 RepID=UPI002952D95A|nr:carbohydrate porin [Vibrio sp. TH_r3]MDV7103061.1 carbohydrate porin [Vibrio sp. TH_r3]
MKNFKVLSLALAVASSLTTFGTVAEEMASENPVTMEAQIADLQKLMADQTNAVRFFGYARYGAVYQAGDSRYVDIGSTGKTVGRLGNEANGGEFGIAKKYTAENDAVWDLAVMVEHWSNDDWGSAGGVNLKRFYAGASNIFESQPDMYVWAGRDFHARLQQGLNDYYVTIEDGQGGGFKNMDLGGASFDLAFVGGVDDNEGSLGNDNGKYAITSKVKDIDAGFAAIDAYAHFGFTSDKDSNIAGGDAEDATAFLVGTQIKFSSSSLHIRYGDGASNSVLGVNGSDYQTLYVTYDGGFSPADNWNIDYLAGFYNQSGDDITEQNEYNLIVRPQYRWDDIHSTWLEAGYAMVDPDEGDTSDAWKLTLSQNISLGGLPWSRPMLRFYGTVGEKSADTTTDTVSIGAMFEAWW